MENPVNSISYSEILKIIRKEKLALVIFFSVGMLISSLLIFLTPPQYSIEKIFRVPVRGYFDLNGSWIEQPFQNGTLLISVFNLKKANYEECQFPSSIIENYPHWTSRINLASVEGNNFSLRVSTSNLDRAKSCLEEAFSSIKQEVQSHEANLAAIQNSLASKSTKYPCMNGGARALADCGDINFARIGFYEYASRIEVFKISSISIYKYGFLFSIIVSMIYILICISRKLIKN